MPETFGNLVWLNILDVGDNNLHSLPASMDKLVNNSKLRLMGNPLIDVPPSVQRWLSELEEDEFVKLLR